MGGGIMPPVPPPAYGHGHRADFYLEVTEQLLCSGVTVHPALKGVERGLLLEIIRLKNRRLCFQQQFSLLSKTIKIYVLLVE